MEFQGGKRYNLGHFTVRRPNRKSWTDHTTVRLRVSGKRKENAEKCQQGKNLGKDLTRTVIFGADDSNHTIGTGEGWLKIREGRCPGES